jgi:hypothetical protein
MLAVVEWHQIFEVIAVSLVIGVGVTGLFATVIHASSRAAEARRTGDAAAVLYGIVAALALTLFAAVVVFGITVILQKS